MFYQHKKVSFKLSGTLNQTDIRVLNEGNKSVLKRSSVDSFILAVKRPLGELEYMKIWHDNSGKGDFASWFLKFIIVKNLQNGEKFYFLCQDWLAVEKSDGKIERELFVACKPQITEIKYLLNLKVHRHFYTGHSPECFGNGSCI